MSQFLKDLQSDQSPSTTSPLNSIHITPHDLADLPPALLEQLNITESDKQEFLIMEILEELGGFASLDKIMIQIYRKNGEIVERQKLNAKLYRMSTKGLIYPFTNKKGIYSLTPTNEEEGKNMEN